MNTNTIKKVVLLLIAYFIGGRECGPQEKRLREKLFNGSYDAEIRPVDDDAMAVELELDIELFQIVKLAEKDQTIEVSAWLRQTWNDHALKWNPLEYGNLTQINVNPDKVWLPDTVLYNSVIEDNDVGGHLDKLHTRIMIHPTGRMQWTAIAILKTHCNIRVRDFPFDTQECHLKFVSWTHGVHMLNIRTKESKMETKSYLSNSEWHLVSTNASRKETKFDCCDYMFSDISFTVTLSRRSSFYICNLVFPISVINLLTILSFLLPAESGERISLVVTLLLSVTVFMLIVADTTPATGDEIPLVSKYFVVSMVDMVILMVTVCYVNRLHHKNPSDGTLSRFGRRFIYDHLSYWLRIRAKENEPDDQNNLKDKKSDISPIFQSKNGHERPEQISLIKATYKEQNGVVQQNGLNGNIPILPDVNKELHENKNHPLLENINNNLNKLISKMEDDELADVARSEWRIVAMTVDRALLIFFFINFVATMIGVFSFAPGYVA